MFACIIAVLSQYALLAARRAPDTDALAVAQHINVEVPQHIGITRQQIEQQRVRLIGGRARADQPNPLADAMDMRIDRQHRLMKAEQ